jgi:hypothetical protein
MANTVPILNFTNTFGDLLSQQNRAAVELNTLGANNYTKDSGTLILNGAGTGLSVTGAAILGSTIVANTSSLIGDVSALANVFINGAGFALDVANNANIRRNTITDTLLANTIIRTTTVNASGNVFANNITSNNSIRAVSVVSSGNTTVNALRSNTSILGASLNITGQALTNALQANTSIESSTLIVSSLGTVNALQSNTSVNTAIVTATNTIIGNNIQANTGLSSTTLSVSGLSSVGSLQANNSVNTATATITGTTFTGVLQANSSVNTATISVTGTGFVNLLQANSSVNTAIITASNSITGRNIQANTGLSSTTLSVSAGTFANTITANTSVTTPTITITSKLDANSAPISFFNSVQTTGQLSVGGDFVINGTTVYSTNTFTLNANSAVGQISTFGVNRGTSGANAAIRWNEPQGYWDIIDVNNPSSFSKILTANLISSSLTSTSTDTFASSLAANTLNNALQANVISLQSQITANTLSLQNQITANVNLISGIDIAQNTRMSIIEGVNLSQNTRMSIIEGVDVSQNTRMSIIEGVNLGQNTTITAVNNYAATGFARANTSANLFIGTTGTANATSGVTTLTSTNGMTIAGSANTLTINTPQDVRTTATPTFNNLTLTNALPITQGGTSATSASSALTNLLPTGTVAGYVLTTSGPGTYFWAPIGAQQTIPGTTIQSTRLSYTANGSGVSYTTPIYIPGASQLRVYFDGVRQFASAYTETSNTVVTFGTAVPSGVNILVEVDGYIDNPYYANNITFTAPQGSIPGSANTIQLAIQDLETRKAALATATFTGPIQAPTASSGTSNTQVATTAFVNNLANSGTTFAHSITGNAGTVTNGVLTTGDQTISGTKTFNASIVGNISTATALQTARTINGTSFNGTANITVTAAASTLTGSSLASGVTASSLTSVGTLTSGALGTGFNVVNVAQGGTGSSSFTTNNVLLGNGSSSFQTVAPGTSGFALRSNGSTWTSQRLGLGMTGEVWNNVTGSRATGTTYTNSNSYPIMFAVTAVKSGALNSQAGLQMIVGGVTVTNTRARTGNNIDFTTTLSATMIVPPGSTYGISLTSETFLETWFELS